MEDIVFDFRDVTGIEGYVKSSMDGGPLPYFPTRLAPEASGNWRLFVYVRGIYRNDEKQIDQSDQRQDDQSFDNVGNPLLFPDKENEEKKVVFKIQRSKLKKIRL